ncbi:MAG: hypothetical protein BIFFINMI_01055 [Phycisphaerae bacterium]|nr:hypothetical protein [Phycisphaerae bacterium]
MKRGVFGCIAVAILLSACAQGRAADEPATGRAWPDVTSLDPARYREAVSTAHQAVKLVYAPLTAEQAAAIDKAWAPAYSYPCPMLAMYLNALLPHVERFLAARGQAGIVAAQFDAAYREANAYLTVGDAVGADEAMAVAWARQRQLTWLQGRMADAAEKIRAMGDPPDAGQCRAKRRREFEESVRPFAPGGDTGPAWVLTGRELKWIRKPEVGRFLADEKGRWADTWSWNFKKDGTSFVSELLLQFRDDYRSSYTDPNTHQEVVSGGIRNGFVRSNLRVVWAQPPTVFPYVEDPRVSKSTFMLIPFIVEDIDQRDKRGFAGSDDKKRDPFTGGRVFEHSFAAVLYAPDGKPVGGYGGYGNMAIERNVYLDRTARLAGAMQIQFRYDPGWWRIPYERAHGKYPPEWNKRTPGEGWKLKATWTVRQRMNGEAPLPGRKAGEVDAAENPMEIQLGWEFTFDPNGGTVAPMDLSDEPDRYRQEAAQSGPPPDPAKAAELAQARAEMIEFHEANIKIAETNAAKWRAELAAAKDPDTREQLVHTLMHAEHTRLAEMDRIRELQTGEVVHTRTPVDEWYAARFVQQVRDRMDPDTRIARYAEGTQRVIRLAPPEQREQLAAFVARQTADAKTWGDADRMQKIAHAVFEQVAGHWEGVSARETEKALIAEQNLRYAQVAKTWAEAEMFAVSLGTSGWVMPAFEGCLGYAGAEGGVGNRLYEGTKNGLMWTNAAGMAAAEAMEGYTKGGWLSGQKGWAGALERGVTTFLAVKGLEYGIGRLFGGHPPPDAKPDVAKAFEQARYRIAMEDSKVLVEDYRRAYKEYQRAMEFGASGPEIQAMEQALRDKATLLHSSYEGKLVLKSASHDPKFAELIADYNQRMAQVHERVQAQFRRVMSDRGYAGADQWVMQEFRNASSAGTVGMDYDIGLMRRCLDPTSPQSRALTEIPFTRGSLRVNAAQLQADAQAAWEAAYHAVTGRSAKRSFETLTTSAHPEIYTDLAWLGTPEMRGVNIGQLQAGKAAQAGDVTAYKAAEMMHDANLLPVSRVVEAARGMSKDINTKLLPLIDEVARQSGQAGARFKAYSYQWKQIAMALERAPANPALANEQIRLLTGGKEIPELALDLRDMIANYGKKLGK